MNKPASAAPDVALPQAPDCCPALTPRDFASDQEVRWCPGCGDYSILAAVRKTLAKTGRSLHNTVFVSGIGCSSRFPYYMATYGFHSIHGRAPAVASGVKIANPGLDVWIVTGDGDGLSIGGNHMVHFLRRNIGCKILLFNNRIYGLTKGQYSPTSEQGKKTKSSPMGSLDLPLRPLSVALACEATFVARCLDVDRRLSDVMERAAAHSGSAFLEIYQDCNVFNHGAYSFATDRQTGAYSFATDRQTGADHVLYLEHGKPLVFGKDRDKGIRLVNHKPEVVALGNGVTEADLLVHDEHDANLAFLLSRLRYPQFPEPVGVFYADESQPTYESLIEQQIATAVAKQGPADLTKLFHSGDTYVVEG